MAGALAGALSSEEEPHGRGRWIGSPRSKGVTKSCTRRDPDGTPGTLDGPEQASGPAYTGPGLRFLWSGRRDSNPRPPPWQGGALPLSHVRAEASSLGAGSGAFNRLSERRMPAHVSNERYILEDDKHEVLFRDLETVGEPAGVRVLKP